KGTATGNLFISAATLQTTDPKYCATGCNDHPFIQLPLNSEWTHYTLQWADLKQAGWGTPVPFDTSTLEYLQFSFLTNTAFDLYLDELNFY
ncbi:MAG TPA: hypothetical protein VFX59_28895, partial [Polyangiales bacterium]|nr:hypothetical protein [Polyangiales bacterium]